MLPVRRSIKNRHFKIYSGCSVEIFNLHGIKQPPVLVVAFVIADQYIELVDQFALDLPKVASGSLLALHHVKENMQSCFAQLYLRY